LDGNYMDIPAHRLPNITGMMQLKLKPNFKKKVHELRDGI
jgi:hypothetical protein